MRLTSSQEKGMTWGSLEEITGLQTCLQNMITRKIKLVDVIQVMLVCRILPCPRRTCYLWDFDSAEQQTLLRLFGTTHEDIWKVLFKGSETLPLFTKDHGLNFKRQANSVSHQGVVFKDILRGRILSLLVNFFFRPGSI